MPTGVYERKLKPIEDRFWQKVDRGGSDDCWEWQGAKSSGGYGHIKSAKRSGKLLIAHRLAWEIEFGPVPKGDGHHGTCVCHRCDNRLCCNPAHLFLGTHQDNMIDMSAKGRHPRNTPNAKLTEDQVRAIRADPRKHMVIADNYGISRPQISSIKRRATWRHV